VAKKKSEPSPE